MDYKLNASEWRVLQALWGHAPQTLMQLVSNLQRSTDWSASTIKTLISRAFGGNFGLLMSNFIDNAKLSKNDLEELYDMLKQAEEGL